MGYRQSDPVMTESLNDQLLARVLPEFAHTLAHRHAVDEVLERLAGHIADLLCATTTGTWLSDPQGRPRPVRSGHDVVREGPGPEAFGTGLEVRVSDLGSDPDRWPRWQQEARRQGVRSALGLPLLVRDQPVGAVEVCCTGPREWQDAEVAVARVLTDLAAGYVAHATELAQSRRTAEQLREALSSRIVIEQAKGVLANDLGCTVDQAFVVLREHARRNSAALRSVAHAVVHLGLRPSRKPSER